jgi:hypothetical protein
MAKEKPREWKQYGNEFLSNLNKAMIFSKISTTSPIIIFPLLSLYFHNWWFLFGILFSYLGGLLSEIKRIWILIVIIYIIFYALKFSFMENMYVNIFFLCYLYGHIIFSLGTYFIKSFDKTKSKTENQVHQMLDDSSERKSKI